MGICLDKVRHLYPEMEPIRSNMKGSGIKVWIEKVSNIYKKYNLNSKGPLYKRGLLSGYVLSSALAKYD